MGATTYARYRATQQERFARLLMAWLSTLPPAGWRAGTAALAAALDAFERARRFCAFVPAGSALTKALLAHEPALRAAGFRLRVGRTKAARFLIIELDRPAAGG